MRESLTIVRGSNATAKSGTMVSPLGTAALSCVRMSRGLCRRGERSGSAGAYGRKARMGTGDRPRFFSQTKRRKLVCRRFLLLTFVEKTSMKKTLLLLMTMICMFAAAFAYAQDMSLTRLDCGTPQAPTPVN